MSLQIGDRVTCTHFSGMYFVIAHATHFFRRADTSTASKGSA